MPFLALVEVIERLLLLYSKACVPVVGLCVSLETSSFFKLVTRPLVVHVTCLYVSLRVGATNLTPIILYFS
jgi:hypothetical protein